jgi:exosortase
MGSVEPKTIRPTAVRAVLLLLVAAGVVLLYGVYGNAQEALHPRHGKSAILWMVLRWQTGGEFSHGWFVPLVSIAMIWWKRRELAAAPVRANWGGLALTVLALLLHWAGVRAQLTRVSLLSMVLLLWSVPLYLYGWRVARMLVYPVAYLLFCIPLSFLDGITVPLRIMASAVSAHILNGIGIAVVRTGTVLTSVEPGGFRLGVADPCSGIRSLIAMTALAAAFAYFTQKTFLKRAALFVLAVPLAVTGNIVRIISVAVVAETMGTEKAMKFYHDMSGILVFVVAVLLMISAGKVLKTDFRKKFRQWKKRGSSTTS